jgi:heme/copper-type cytochrome/quinol oxidase subunit 2
VGNILRLVLADALEIKVSVYMWYWEFYYGNNMLSEELVIPIAHNATGWNAK